MFQIAAVCVVAALLCVVLKKGVPEQALLLALATVTGVLVVLIDPVRELMLFFEELSRYTGLANGLFLPLYKTVGISFVVRMGSGLCRDAGETALASVLETSGAVCTLLVALPLLRSVVALFMEFLE